MAAAPTEHLPQQLFVFGQGIEPVGRNREGDIDRDSPYSRASFYLALTAATYCADHPEVEHVVFSGRASVWMSRSQLPAASMAAKIQEIAQFFHDRPGLYRTEQTSWTMCEGIARSAQAGLLDPDLVTGIIVGSRRQRYGLRIGRLVLPETIWVPLMAQDIYGTNDHTPSVGSPDLVTKYLQLRGLRNVEPGDIDAILAQDQSVQQTISQMAELRERLQESFWRVIEAAQWMEPPC